MSCSEATCKLISIPQEMVQAVDGIEVGGISERYC